MNLGDYINAYEQKLKKLKISQLGDSPKVSIHSLDIYKNQDFSVYTNQDLFLVHAWLHKSYVDKNPKIPKNWVPYLHKSCKEEMNKRGLKHQDFDKLDSFDTIQG